jgi:hypothetical protein
MSGMTDQPPRHLRLVLAFATLLMFIAAPSRASAADTAGSEKPGTDKPRRLLYVASPGIRDYLEYGGHGVLVYDIDHGHSFVRRIPTRGVSKDGKPLNVKGVCASAATGRLYVSTIQSLMCLDLASDQLLWEKQPEGGCDRMAISPDGKLIFTPSLEGPHWNVIDASSGDVVKKVVVNSGAHNTMCGLDGKFAYFAGLKSPVLRVFDVEKREVVREVGPFGNVIRPFTVNGAGTLCFVNVNELLGFEVGDLASGKMLHRVEVDGFKKGETKRHGCPSHGVALTPDEKELWLTDAANSRLHVFDATVMPPRQVRSIELSDQPGWVTFGIDGKYAYPSTGDVIDAKSKKIVVVLRDEHQNRVQSEKMLEIDFGADGKATKAGDQFGIGRVAGAEPARAE